MPPNIFAQGMDAFKDSYATQQTMRQDRGRVQAGRALAGGDRPGAAAAFGDAGLTDEVRQVQNDQTAADETTYQHGQDAQKLKVQEQTRRGAFLKDISQGLKGVPAGQRKAALDQVLPHFQDLGLDPQQFASLTEDQLTDQNLDLFSGEIDKHQLVNLGGGGAGSFNQRTGKFETLREPTQKAPLGFEYDESGNLAPIPGYVQGRAAIATATRAPRHARAAGALGGLPPGYRPK